MDEEIIFIVGAVMKVIIAGSRGITDYHILKEAWGQFKYRDEVSEIVCGEAPGIDTLGRRLGEELDIYIASFPAQWDTPRGFDRGAGRKRNAAMGDYADALLAIWDFESVGTKHMIDYSNNLGLYVEIYNANGVRVIQNRYW